VSRQAQDQQNEETSEGLNDCWNLTEDHVLQILKEKGEVEGNLDKYFANIDKNPSKAVLLYYLNSGHGWFQQRRQFDKSYDEQEVDVDALCKEIEDEMLDSKELYKLFDTFYKRHSFTENSLWSCGMCGIRELQSKEVSHPSKCYRRIILENLTETEKKLIQYTEDQEEKFQTLVGRGSVLVPADASENNNLEIKPWEAISYYEHHDVSSECVRYHLHRELVDVDSDGKTGTWLCPTCYKQLNKGMKPKLSITAGVDFGNFGRIQGITKPNLHEQIVLSQIRLFQAIIKVLPNYGYQQNFTRWNIKWNAILFAQDAPVRIGRHMCDVDYLKESLVTYLMDDKRRVDHLLEVYYEPHPFLLGHMFVNNG